MKFTNVKQLIIKFMGGGLINFPTRFLRWVKINGDTDDSDDGGGGDSTEIDYEDIYQFYKEEISKIVPEPVLQEAIIPEHLNDVQDGIGNNEEYARKFGIWKSNSEDINNIIAPTILHTIISDSNIEVIYFAEYKYQPIN